MKKTSIAILLSSFAILPHTVSAQNAGQVLVVPKAPNTEPETGSFNAPEGFAISINGVPLDSSDPQVEDQARRVDEVLERANIQVKYDGLDIRPRLDLEILGDADAYAAGDAMRVRSILNYPYFVARGEIRIISVSKFGGAKTLRVIEIDPNGDAQFEVPTGENIALVHRVYDAKGRYDETFPIALSNPGSRAERDGNEEGEDFTARRRIPISGGSVTVFGEGLRTGQRVTTLGENLSADDSGRFVVQRILPPGTHSASISDGGHVHLVRQVTIPQSDWFYVGAAELTFGKRYGDLYGEENIRRGRASFYADGRRADGTRITASLDTGEEDLDEIFRRLDERDPQSILRRIDETDLYPTYGDDSSIEDGAPTSGKFYFRIEKNENYLQWGDTQATLSSGTYLRNEREHYGLSGQWTSDDLTSFGEPRLTVSGYAAQPDQVPQRDVFQATDGTFFFLQRQDISFGTERVTVQLRDATTGRVLETRTLQAITDYQINYIQGVITLNQPLLQSFASSGVVITDPGGDQDVSLVVQYEYTPTTGNVDTFAYGGRVEGWVNDQIRLGVTGMTEEAVAGTQEAIGIDLRYRLSEDSHLSFDYAQTDGPGFGSSFSSDGGLIFDTEAPAAGNGRALRAEGHLELSDLGSAQDGVVGFYFEDRTEGFSTLDYEVSSTTGDESLWGVYAEISVADDLDWQFTYDNYSNGVGEHERVGEISLEFQYSKSETIAVGLEHVDKDRGSTTENGRRTDIGARWTRKVSNDLEYYLYGQATVSNDGLDRNDRIGAGGTIKISENWKLTGEASTGSLGFGAQLLASYDDGDGNSRYAGYDLTPGRSFNGVALNGRDQGRYIVGGRQSLTDDVSVFAENSYDIFGRHRSLATNYGVTYDYSERTSYTGTFSAGAVTDDINGDFDRYAVTLGFRHKSEGMSGGGRLEYRKDEGTIGGSPRETDTLLVSGDLSYEIDEENRLKFLFEAVHSDSGGLVADGDYLDFIAGYSHRPIWNDRLNVLLRYRYLFDDYGQNVDGFAISGPIQRSHVLSADGIYELNERWEVGAKLGLRISESAPDGNTPLVENNAYLAVANARWHVVSSWDALFEVRSLHLESSGQTETGFLGAVYKHAGNNWKVGLGYNFTNFSDDLTDLTYDDKGVFLNVVAKF